MWWQPKESLQMESGERRAESGEALPVRICLHCRHQAKPRCSQDEVAVPGAAPSQAGRSELAAVAAGAAARLHRRCLRSVGGRRLAAGGGLREAALAPLGRCGTLAGWRSSTQLLGEQGGEQAPATEADASRLDPWLAATRARPQDAWRQGQRKTEAGEGSGRPGTAGAAVPPLAGSGGPKLHLPSTRPLPPSGCSSSAFTVLHQVLVRRGNMGAVKGMQRARERREQARERGSRVWQDGRRSRAGAAPAAGSGPLEPPSPQGRPAAVRE